MIAELDEFLTARGLDFAALIGQAADRLAGYGEQSPDSDRWRRFVPAETLDQSQTTY
jgi:hypothetical protein